MAHRAARTAVLVLAALGWILAAGGSRPLFAEDAAPGPRAVVVLDSSGAMLNPIEAFKKYYWVRKSLQTQLATPPQGLTAGLVAYGHRLKAACTDVELLRPVEQFDAGRFLNTVASIRPHGQTPVAEALKLAAAALGKGGGKVLLIAGSADSCQQDPCATARDLVAAEPGLAIDVLSIGVTEADNPQMQCIAESGHGHLFAAATMADSPKAFAEAFAALPAPPVVAAAQPPVPDAAPVTASGLNLSAQLTAGASPNAIPLNWIVRKLEDGKPGAIVFRAEASTTSAPLPAGTYDVETAGGVLDLHQSAEVAAGQANSLVVTLNAGSLRLKVSAAKPDDAGSELYYSVYRTTSNPEDDTPDATLAMLRDPVAAPLLLPAGTYRIVANRGAVRDERTLDIIAGQEALAEFALRSGKLQIVAEGGAESRAEVQVYFVSEDDPDQPLGRRDVAQSAVPNPLFELPPGVYHISTREGAGKVRLDAVVRAGEVTKISVPDSMGSLRLETDGLPAGANLPDDLITYTVERLDEAGKPQSIAARRSSSQPSIELQAGTYRVTGRVGLVNIASSADVVVKAGVETRSKLTQHFGLLDLAYGDAPAAAVDVLWEIRDNTGKSVWSTTVPAPLVPLAPGDYWVHATRFGKDQALAVTVTSGDRKTVAIRPE